eukprot:4719729-Amphidinium_carterae.1
MSIRIFTLLWSASVGAMMLAVDSVWKSSKSANLERNSIYTILIYSGDLGGNATAQNAGITGWKPRLGAGLRLGLVDLGQLRTLPKVALCVGWGDIIEQYLALPTGLWTE